MTETRPVRRLVQYPPYAHRKNVESIQRMCAAAGIQYEATNDKSRLSRDDYELLWLPTDWIPPPELPAHVRIVYGPHYWVFPEGPVVGPRRADWSQRAVYTTLSEWNQRVFSEITSESVVPFVPLPFGIDPTLEDYRAYPKTLDCLVYFKHRDRHHLDSVKSILSVRGLSFQVIEYGSYANADYEAALKRVKFCIWIGCHESQGFAFQECLAHNVPILVWDATSMFYETGGHYHKYLGIYNLAASTATVWSPACGIRIEKFGELASALEEMGKAWHTYKPRELILAARADGVVMRQWLDYFGIAPP